MSFLFKKIVIAMTTIMYFWCLFLTVFNIWLNSFNNSNITNEIILPRINIQGDISNMVDKKDERIVVFSYSDTDADFSFEKYIKIKIQGSSSIKYEKKNYTIKFYNDKECNEKYKVDFGWGEANKYVLKANWIDKTHARNVVSARIVASVNKKYGVLENTPNYGEVDGFPVEVYNNDKFLGLYTLNIPKDAWTYGLDEDNSSHLAFEAEYSSVHTKFERIASKYGGWTLEVGEENQENLDKLNRAIDFVVNSSDKEFKENFQEYFDLDATLNYYVISETLLLSDNFAKNMMLITYDGEIWYPVLYDLDSSFASNSYGNTIYGNNVSAWLERSNFFARFSDVFANEIAERYFELRQDIFTEDNLNNELDEFMLGIPISSIHKEEYRWGEVPGYGVAQIRDFINNRFDYLDVEMAKKFTEIPDCETEKNNNYCKIFS